MRKKKAAKMAMESKIPAKPSSMAPYFLNLPVEVTVESESEESNMDGDLRDDETGVDVNESSEGEGNSVEEHEKLKERTCIVCDKVGPLLVCSSHQCPSSYHLKCLPAPPSSDDLVKFYCPHCSYQQANAESNLAFENYKRAKYALLQFLKGMDGEKKKQEAQESVTKEPNPPSHATAEDDSISNINLEKGVHESESKKNGQEEDVINEQNNTEAHESALNEPVKSQLLDDYESAEMAGYQKESELNKVLTKLNCESAEISREHGREEEVSFNSVESEFTEFSADSSNMVKKADIESDSDVSSSDNVPLTMLLKKLVAQRTEMIKMDRLLNVKGSNTSSCDQKSSVEAGRKEKASFNPVESEFTEFPADSSKMMKKADIGSDSDISSSDHESLTTLQKKLVAQQTEMTEMGQFSNFKGKNTSSSDQKSSMEDGRKEEAFFNPVQSEFTEFSADSLRMAKKADIQSDSDISSSDHEPLTKRQKKCIAQGTEMIKMGRLSSFKGKNLSPPDQKSSMEDGRKEEASFHPVESEFPQSLADSVGMEIEADVESDISNSDHEPLTKRQKKLVAQRTEREKMSWLSNVKANKAYSSNQKSPMEENTGEKPKSSGTRIGVLRCLRMLGGHEREEKTPSDSAQSTHMLDSMEMPKKTSTDSDISDSDREIQELEETNNSPLFNYFTYQMALEKEKVKGTETEEVSSKSKRVQSFSKRSKTLILTSGRREKRFWSDEEKEMLKEGVLKFSTTTNKNLPWQKILDFGHNVFDKTRTPTDLKDKWRNMLAEETPTEN